MLKKFKGLIILLLVLTPNILYAKTYNYNKAIQEGNAYINSSKFKAKNKYLITNGDINYKMQDNGLIAYDGGFKYCGFLNKREFCLSTGRDDCKGKSYLVIPTTYWTASGNPTNRYNIDMVKGLNTKSDNNQLGSRVTQYVKPEATVSGLGTYANPWIFFGSYYVSLSTNSKKYATFNETGTNKLEKYSSESCISGAPNCINFEMTLHHGYENNSNDGCGLKLLNRNARVHQFEISSIKDDIECIAVFVKKTFTISFNCDTGNGTVANKTVVYDNNLVLPGDSCSRVGYTQDGWVNGSNEKWALGSTIKFTYDDDEIGIHNKQLSLKASFRAHKYTVVYHGNGATDGSTAASSHTFDVSKNLTSNGFSRKGYLFAGWATTSGGNVVYSNGQSVINLTSADNGTFDLHAKWTPITYTVVYHGNGATGGSTAASSHTYDSAKALTANGFSKTGHSFAGWATSESGGVSYSNGQSVSNLSSTNGGTVNLYAKWTANTYTITYNANGGSGAPTATTYTYDPNRNTNLSGSVPSREYYTFTGWSQSAGGPATYSAGQAWSRGNASNYTLYAQWRKNYIILRFDMNGGYWGGSSEGSFGTSGSLVTRWGDINVEVYEYDYPGIRNLPNYDNSGWINIKRNGYHAVGNSQWCTGSNGGGTCYNQSTDYNFQNAFASVCNARWGDCALTLYVHWEQDGGGGGYDYIPLKPRCFVAGTKVLTPDGFVDIETLRPGDAVYSYNEAKGTYEVDHVAENYQRLSNEDIYTIYTSNDSLSVTPTHPFYVKGKGWVEVKDLKVGDILVNNLGEDMPIVKIDKFKNFFKLNINVYNLKTKKNHTYFVGFDSTLVHNKGCFPAGTKVVTKDGYKDIDKIKVGDIVLSYNEETKKNEYNKVTEVFIHDPNDIDDELYTLSFDDNTSLKVTSPHRFYILRNNKYSWISAEDLKLNDKVLYTDGKYHKITKISKTELNEFVYNIEVENNHNYYVGKQGILVHNYKTHKA